MSVGDIRIIDGIEFEVVWDGGEGLVGERVSKPTGFWTPPKRLYNKTGNHASRPDFWSNPKAIDNPVAEESDSGGSNEV